MNESMPHELTPLQELIKLIEKHIDWKEGNHKAECVTIYDVSAKAQSLLPKEKQMVVESYDNGVFNSKLQQTTLYTNGETYFNEKHNR